MNSIKKMLYMFSGDILRRFGLVILGYVLVFINSIPQNVMLRSHWYHTDMTLISHRDDRHWTGMSLGDCHKTRWKPNWWLGTVSILRRICQCCQKSFEWDDFRFVNLNWTPSPFYKLSLDCSLDLRFSQTLFLEGILSHQPGFVLKRPDAPDTYGIKAAMAKEFVNDAIDTTITECLSTSFCNGTVEKEFKKYLLRNVINISLPNVHNKNV